MTIGTKYRPGCLLKDFDTSNTMDSSQDWHQHHDISQQNGANSREWASTLIFAYSTHTGLCFSFLTKIILNNLNYQIVFDVENIRIFHSHSNIWCLQSIVKKIAIYESFFVHYALGLIATSLRTSFVLLLGLWSVGPFWSVFYYYFTVSFSSLFLGGIKSHSKGNKIIHTGVEIYYNIAKYLFVPNQNWFLNRFCNFSMLRNSQ